MSKVKAVIFDLDGTLLESLEDLKQSCNKTLKEMGFPERSFSEVRSFVGNGIRKLMELALPENAKNRTDEAFNLMKKNYAENPKTNTIPYEGVQSMIEELCKLGIKCAIVSNKPDAQVKELRNRFFPQIPLEAAIGETEGIPRKPSPQGIWNALKIINAKIEDSIYVGDSEVDLLTAKNSGLKCISVLWGFRDKEMLIQNGAETFASNTVELKEIILK